MLSIPSRIPTLTNKLPDKSFIPFKPWEGSSVFVNQGKHWSSAFIWLSASLFGFSFIWAFTAKVDQTISVRGVLNPLDSTRTIEAPSSGVVSKVYVKDGQYIKAGSPLLTFESDSITSRKNAIKDTLDLVNFEVKALSIIVQDISLNEASSQLSQLPLPLYSEDKSFSRFVSARDQSFQIIAQLSQLSNRLNSKNSSLDLQSRMLLI